MFHKGKMKDETRIEHRVHVQSVEIQKKLEGSGEDEG